MSLLHTSLQHISRSSKKNKNYCSIIKAVCKQQLQEEEKNIKFSFDQFLGSNPGSITVVTLQLRYTDLISFIA